MLEGLEVLKLGAIFKPTVYTITISKIGLVGWWKGL